MKYFIVLAYIFGLIVIIKASEKNSNVVLKTKSSELALTNNKKTSNIVIKDKHKGSFVLNNDKNKGSNIVMKNNAPEQGTIVMNTNKKANNIIIRDKYGSLVVNTKNKGGSNIVIKENPKPMVTYEPIHEPIFPPIKETIHEPLYQPTYEHLDIIDKQLKFNQPIQESIHGSIHDKIHETLLKPIYRSSIEKNEQLTTRSSQQIISEPKERSIEPETRTDFDFLPSVPKFLQNMQINNFGNRIFTDHFRKKDSHDLKASKSNDFPKISGLYMEHLENPLIEENGAFENKNEKSVDRSEITDYNGFKENKEKQHYSSEMNSFPEVSNDKNLPIKKNNDHKYPSYFDEYETPYNKGKLKDIERDVETSVEQQVEHQIEDQIASGEIVTNANYDRNNDQNNNYHSKALQYDYPKYIKSKHLY